MININTAIRTSKIDDIDAKYLMCFVLGLDLPDLALQIVKDLSAEQLKLFNELVMVRKTGKPVDAIIGTKGFWQGEFIVDENVLSPRPDSEVIIETALKHFPIKDEPYNILDLGTGSGCLLISLLMEYKNANGLGADVSDSALNIARINAKKNNVSKQSKFIKSDWLKDIPQQTFDIIVANPPYVRSGDINELQVEVKNYDPLLSLDGGGDGLNPYHIISANIKDYMNENSMLIIEFGYDQSDFVADIFENKGYELVQKTNDLGGIIRTHTYKIKKSS